MPQNDRSTAAILVGLALLIVALGTVSNRLSLLLGAVYGSALIVWANPLALPALACLWFSAEDFSMDLTRPSLREYEDLPPDADLVLLKITLASLPAVAGRVLLEAVIRPQSLLTCSWSRYAFAGWIFFLGLTTASSFWGWTLGNENWTQPLRASLPMGALFYGMMIVTKLKKCPWVLMWVGCCGFAATVFYAAGVYWHHIVFFYLALCPFLAAHLVSSGKRGAGLLFMLPCVTAPLTLDMTFTQLGTLVIASFVAGSSLNTRGPALRRIRRVGIIVLPFAAVLFLVLVLLQGERHSGVFDGAELSFFERLTEKVIEDRNVIWQAVLRDMVYYTEWISPSGRPLELTTLAGVTSYWEVHCHNAFLEMYRQMGIIGGTFFGVSLLSLWMRWANVVAATEHSAIYVFGGAGFVSCVVGATTGIYPFDQHAGFWIWLSAGIVGLARE